VKKSTPGKRRDRTFVKGDKQRYCLTVLSRCIWVYAKIFVRYKKRPMFNKERSNTREEKIQKPKKGGKNEIHIFIEKRRDIHIY